MNDYPLTIHQLLEMMLLRGASDLHLKAGCTPGLRIDGQLLPVEGVPPLAATVVDALLSDLMTPEHLQELERRGDLEFAYTVANVSRYRVSLVRQRGSTGAVLRRIPVEIPDIDRLGLPAIVKKLCLLPRGLVLVTGPTGSGKSTTLAAMVDYLNREVGGHLVTMEDPIEFLHADQAGFITQREIGTDCESFGQALRRALRHDPDVIMIGELRDPETISLALTAAETGHLVLATVHTPGAVQTVDRMLDAFPTDQRSEARGRLAATLQAVFSQTLVNKSGGGRLAAVEVMVVTEAIRSCIREGKTHQVMSQIQTGSMHGMQTQAAALADLVRKSAVSEEAAFQCAANVDELRQALISGGVHLRSLQRPGGVALALRRGPPGPVESLPTAETAGSGSGSSPAATAVALPKVSTASILEKLRRS